MFALAAFPAVLLGDATASPCQKIMAFGWGDAVDDRLRCTTDPSGKPINVMAMRLLSSTISGAGRFMKVRARSDEAAANETLSSSVNGAAAQRSARMLRPNHVEVFDSLLSHTKLRNGETFSSAFGRSDSVTGAGVCGEGCSNRPLLPESCCEVRTEVAYPQFGQSAISEATFTIIQDFPDFVQPVFKRVCVTSQCNIILGNCTQKYVPHAVFSAPSGKFGNLFGQDYLLVESGCECSPYNARPADTAKYSPQQQNLNGSLDNVASVNANANRKSNLVTV
ncbi:hypothetical protein BV898_02964 [Hypsibius exemplaris]|uniref:Spaetzle domain-containing protein n=1 Tax=Hypsibius exemplaris TaxID=2072580 RepID=A0A1W0X748_HYPEX|nr:hypothetical protein BV898_02964 [Hypsibius exemplaris]